MKLVGKWVFREGKGWVGVIYDEILRDGKIFVVTVNVEETEYEIKEWLQGSIDSMSRGGEQLPDRRTRLGLK